MVNTKNVIWSYIDENGRGCFSWEQREGAAKYIVAEWVNGLAVDYQTRTVKINAIKRHVDECLRGLIEDSRWSAIEGAINWGDLSCTEVAYFENSHGASGYRVYISEAEPGCTGIINHVEHYMAARGYTVEVITEW